MKISDNNRKIGSYKVANIQGPTHYRCFGFPFDLIKLPDSKFYMNLRQSDDAKNLPIVTHVLLQSGQKLLMKYKKISRS